MISHNTEDIKSRENKAGKTVSSTEKPLARPIPTVRQTERKYRPEAVMTPVLKPQQNRETSSVTTRSRGKRKLVVAYNEKESCSSEINKPRETKVRRKDLPDRTFNDTIDSNSKPDRKKTSKWQSLVTWLGLDRCSIDRHLASICKFLSSCYKHYRLCRSRRYYDHGMCFGLDKFHKIERRAGPGRDEFERLIESITIRPKLVSVPQAPSPPPSNTRLFEASCFDVRHS